MELHASNMVAKRILRERCRSQAVGAKRDWGEREFCSAQHRLDKKKEKGESKGRQNAKFSDVVTTTASFVNAEDLNRCHLKLNQHCRECKICVDLTKRGSAHVVAYLRLTYSVITFSHVKKFSTSRNFSLDSLVNHLTIFIYYVFIMKNLLFQKSTKPLSVT